MTESIPSAQEVLDLIDDWAVIHPFGKPTELAGVLADEFSLSQQAAFEIADLAINVGGKIDIESIIGRTQSLGQEVTPDQEPPQGNNLAPIKTVDVEGQDPISGGKKHILTLDFKHPYFKLDNDEFTTLRGKNLYYKYFSSKTGKRRLIKGDIVRITKRKQFFCYCKIQDLELRSIESIPLSILKKDGEHPDLTIETRKDFLDLINSFLPPHYQQATLKSEKTLLFLEKPDSTGEDLGTKSGSQDPHLGTKSGSQDPHLGTKSGSQDPVLGPDFSENIGKIMELIQVDPERAQKFNPIERQNAIKVVKKGQEFFITTKIQGLSREFKKCYKGNCRCMKGNPHGPYYYLRIRDPVTGKRTKIYFGRAPE